MSIYHSDLREEDILKILENPSAKLYFIGIGGESMSALAALSLSFGYTVFGSDREERPTLSSLLEKGADIRIGHSCDAFPSGVSLAVYTLAIAEDNPAYQRAKALGVPLCSRAQYLGAWMRRYPLTIGVSGSHGKSTTTGWLSTMLSRCGEKPTVLSGAKLPSGENYLLGERQILVYEGCEYRDSFLRFSPSYLCLLNLEWDHADYFPNETAIENSFLSAANRAEIAVIYNKDDENLSRVMQKCQKPSVSVGQDASADFRIRNVRFEGGFASYDLCHGGFVLSVDLHVPGIFQVYNSALSLALLRLLGFPLATLSSAVSAFRGIERRLSKIRIGERLCFTDYAHHPTEIAAGIETVKAVTGGEVSVVFAPHTYSRTAAFFGEFVRAFAGAARVYLTEIYPAREAPLPGITSKVLADAIGKKAAVVHPEDRGEILQTAPGTLIFMGAGDLRDFVGEK